MSIEEEQRAAFEEWMCSGNPKSTLAKNNLIRKPNDSPEGAGEYRGPTVQFAWEVWQASQADMLKWVLERWKIEVENRAKENLYRNTLDITWRQMIRHLGGDDRQCQK